MKTTKIKVSLRILVGTPMKTTKICFFNNICWDFLKNLKGILSLRIFIGALWIITMK